MNKSENDSVSMFFFALAGRGDSMEIIQMIKSFDII